MQQQSHVEDNGPNRKWKMAALIDKLGAKYKIVNNSSSRRPKDDGTQKVDLKCITVFWRLLLGIGIKKV